MGHNLALYHDRYTLANNEDGAGESFDNHIPYGYIEPEGAFYTTMAYQSSCTDVFAGAACDVAPIYSTPDVVIDGSPAGASEAVVEAANAGGALSLTLPWAVGYASQQDYTGLSLVPNGEGSATLSWADNPGVDYLLLDRSCNQNRFFSATEIAAATEVTGGSAEGTLLDTSALQACLLESIDGVGYRAVAEYQANIDQTGSQSNYLLAQDNAVWVTDNNAQQTINFTVADDTVANSDIQLAVYTDSNGGRPARVDGVAQANEWFDVNISGTGFERTASVDFLMSPREIAAELAGDDRRNSFNLPLALVDTRFNEYSVSSVVWVGDDPQQTNKGLPYGFFESGEFLLDQQPYEISALLNNLPADATVTVEQAGDIVLPNFSYTVAAGDVPSQRLITVDGDPVSINSNGSWQLVASWGERADQSVTLSLSAYAEDGERLQDVQILSDPVANEDILMQITLADLEDNSFWDTLEVSRLVPGGSDVVIDTPQSQDGNVFVFNLGQLDAGDYEFQISLDYVDGGQVVYSLELTVNEADSGDANQSPTVSVNGPSAEAEVGVSFSVSANASDPDGDSLTYAWQQTAGDDLTLSGINSDELTVTADAEGSYTVEVTVTDAVGASATASYSFNATLPPEGEPVVSPDNEGSSGGSAGWLMILMGLLGAGIRRRSVR